MEYRNRIRNLQTSKASLEDQSSVDLRRKLRVKSQIYIYIYIYIYILDMIICNYLQAGASVLFRLMLSTPTIGESCAVFISMLGVGSAGRNWIIVEFGRLFIRLRWLYKTNVSCGITTRKIRNVMLLHNISVRWWNLLRSCFVKCGITRLWNILWYYTKVIWKNYDE